MAHQLNQKLAEAAARQRAAQRRNTAITSIVVLPLVVVSVSAAHRVGFYPRPSFWMLCTLVVGGLVYALVSTILDREG